MMTFSQPITPAVKAHIDAQCSLLNAMSQKVFENMQKINELNVQVAKTLLEESLNTTQQVMVANTPYEALSVAAAQAQPNTEKLRAYQQHVANIVARIQVDLAKTAESHVPNTSRTAAAVADEVARKASEETEKATQRQKAAIEKLGTPINVASDANKGQQQGSRVNA